MRVIAPLTFIIILWSSIILLRLQTIEHKIDQQSILLRDSVVLKALYSIQPTALRDYQLQLSQDSIVIYDGNRKVGVVDYDNDTTNKFANIILKDNE